VGQSMYLEEVTPVPGVAEDQMMMTV
jgi:hypothetical protein